MIDGFRHGRLWRLNFQLLDHINFGSVYHATILELSHLDLVLLLERFGVGMRVDDFICGIGLRELVDDSVAGRLVVAASNLGRYGHVGHVSLL